LKLSENFGKRRERKEAISKIRDLREGEGGKTTSQLGSYVELPEAERRNQD
jgi:hypothetical protein